MCRAIVIINIHTHNTHTHTSCSLACKIDDDKKNSIVLYSYAIDEPQITHLQFYFDLKNRKFYMCACVYCPNTQISHKMWKNRLQRLNSGTNGFLFSVCTQVLECVFCRQAYPPLFVSSSIQFNLNKNLKPLNYMGVAKII